MTPEVASYVAGFFDGEGCVGIKRSGSSHQPYATIGQTRPEVLQRIQALFGGSIRFNKHSNCWIYWASSRVALQLLRAIEPYAIVKLEEIKLVIRAFERTTFDKKAGVPKDLRELRERNMLLVQQMRKLHKEVALN